jgi:hypothetical protein
MDTDAIYTMLSLVAIIIISILINYFLVTETSFLSVIPYVNGTDLQGAAFSGVVALDFILY